MAVEDSARRLGLSEAYHVANRWLTHAGATPRAIKEPVDGIVELIGQGFHARVRIDSMPLGQGAVLGLIRAVENAATIRLMLFSVTGFTTGALVFADAQGVALFRLTVDGDVTVENAHARVLGPEDPLEPAFAPSATAEPEPESVIDPDTSEEAERVIWRDCPRCGATHHPRSNFCASCGSDLHTRLATLGSGGVPAIPSPSNFDTRGGRLSRDTPLQGQLVPLRHDHGPSLRCRTCGSNDIELLEPDR